MQLPSIVILVVAAIVVLFVLRPAVLRNPPWRATVTPLASIIGSGFLVAGPILAHAAGNWAWLAMLGLCAVAYLFGSAIRHNILAVEPELAEGPSRAVARLERVSGIALSFAYFVSVAYYLNLLAAFGLRGVAVVDPEAIRWASSAVILGLGLLGAWRGLRGLESLEVGAVGLKLGLIAGLVAGLALSSGLALLHRSFALPHPAHDTGFHEIGVLLGLVILVQGFETSRFLGESYDAATRVRTMRYAQWLSSAIYVCFILLITPFFHDSLPAAGGETAIIDILAPLGLVVAPLIIVTALASQLSAAVADMNGASGLLAASAGDSISLRLGYLLTAAAALGVTWVADIYEIIVYASKAFVVYYGLQCALAALVAARPGANRNRAKALLFACGTLFALAVLIFGVPAEGG